MNFFLISTLVLVILTAGTAMSDNNRQKRFILLKRLLQMNGKGESTLSRDPDPIVPSCPPIYIQQQAQTEATQASYYTTTPVPYHTTTPAPYYTSPAYNPPAAYDYTTATPTYNLAPLPAYNQPTYSPIQPRYEQLPTYLQMPPTPYVSEHNFNQKSFPTSYQSPLVAQHVF